MNNARRPALHPSPALRALVLAVVLAIAPACSDDGGASSPGDVGTDGLGDVAADAGDGGDAAAATCDETRTPIVFVHGFLGSGDTFANHAARFATNGYCLEDVHAFDWNSLDQQADHEEDLDAFIVDVLSDDDDDRVDLAGHSAGGSLGYRYLRDAERAARVAHYAHIGSGLHDGPAGPDGAPVPTLNLWSEDDLVIDDKGDIPGATNVMLSGDDHYAVATSQASFEAIYTFFNGEAPPTTSIDAESEITLSGMALSLGENLPAAGASLAIYTVDPATGFRAGSEPAAELTVADDGAWGPFEAAPDIYYEFRILGTDDDDRPVHYYFEPFERSSRLVYLRVLPPPTTLAGILLSGIPFDDEASVLVNFTAATGIIAGRDSLTVDGLEAATEAIASADQTTIALFFYDDNGNQTSDATPIAAFANFPFLNGLDLFFSTDTEASIEVAFNGRMLRARNWPSDSEGATITVFR